ncbi:hypothetical protein VOLCADRAFT_94986 [Volvox carteri f. nagariensis]|uniref:Uncharacterized protein n=1 Tax=Volvox carteri f. nagariensis TaxID=3068 RepID=D8U6A8_VOLCA|nr:uncharacterized protein VOLCADRAFT_94986 [Volvox carteri f. nagariensis]EFJ44681.1 hypothetical protein VOLCADRAFT_94986 [Volvox carteri f. nagariensis]|eukprot:XP_002954257.1 hypothetical protein VOLCADRAFT_94986 [Volvox carteri f. nagariensis]
MADEIRLVKQRIKKIEGELADISDRLEEQLGAASLEEFEEELLKRKRLILQSTLATLRQTENLLFEQHTRGRCSRASPSVERFWKQLPSATLAMSAEGMEVLQLAPGTEFPRPHNFTALLLRPCYRALSEEIFAAVSGPDGYTRRVLIRGTPGKLSGLSVGVTLFQGTGDGEAGDMSWLWKRQAPCLGYFDVEVSVSGLRLQEEYHSLLNAGIGKSMFLYYLLYELACQGKTVVWQGNSMASVLLYTPNGVFQSDSTFAFSAELHDPSTWFLCDAVEPSARRAITVMVSIPRNSNYNDYMKLGPMRLWMSPWSMSELEAARRTIFTSVTDDALSRLYARWGGIPRYVLEHANSPTQQKKLDEVVAVITMDLLFRSVRNIEAATEDNIHKLFHIQVNEEHEKECLDFGSEEIGQRVMQRLYRQYSTTLTPFLRSAIGRLDLASLRGPMFRWLVDILLPMGGTYCVRSLSDTETFRLTMPEMELEMVQDSALKEMSLTTVKSGLLVPISKDFPVVDYFLILPGSSGMAERLLFIVVTVSANHHISALGLQAAVQKLSRDLQGLKCELCFAVPPDLFESFTEQPFEEAETMAVDAVGMEQFAVQIPLVAVMVSLRQLWQLSLLVLARWPLWMWTLGRGHQRLWK